MAGQKITSFPKNQENPFMLSAMEEIKEHFVRRFVNSSGPDRKAVLNMVDEESGEILQTRFVRQMIIDDDKFTKVFNAQMNALYDLSTSGLKVFGYLTTCLQPAKDLIVFNMQDCLAYTGYKSVQPVYNGLAELCKANIIARGWSDNIWFINPQIAFNGSRVTLVMDYIKRSAAEQKAAVEARHQAERKQIAEDITEFENNEN